NPTPAERCFMPSARAAASKTGDRFPSTLCLRVCPTSFWRAPGSRPSAGRPVHEPDSHVRTQSCQSVRLSDRAATAREGAEAKPVGVDALELPRNPGAACHACSRVIGTSLENSRKRVSDEANLHRLG